MNKVDEISSGYYIKLADQPRLHFFILVQMSAVLNALAGALQGTVYILSMKEKCGCLKILLLGFKDHGN